MNVAKPFDRATLALEHAQALALVLGDEDALDNYGTKTKVALASVLSEQLQIAENALLECGQNKTQRG